MSAAPARSSTATEDRAASFGAPVSQATKPTLLDQVASVKFGDIKGVDFARAIYSGRDNSAPLALNCSTPAHIASTWAHPSGVFVWSGGIPGATGEYYVANPYRCSQIGAYDPLKMKYGTGLTIGAISEIAVCTVEVDEAQDGSKLPLEEQARIYDEIEAETGLRFCAAVLSGDARPGMVDLDSLHPYTLQAGKSIHVSLAIKGAAPTMQNLKLYEELYDALVAYTCADPACSDISHKMRFGGVKATNSQNWTVRVQTALRAETDCAVDLQVARDAMVSLCQRKGIPIQARIQALRLSHQYRCWARHWEEAWAASTVAGEEAEDAAQGLRDVALQIRQKGLATPVLVRIATSIGGPKGTQQVHVGIEKKEVKTAIIDTELVVKGFDPSALIVTHASGDAGTPEYLWARHLRGYRVPDVHCPGHLDKNPSAYITRSKWGEYRIVCPNCGVIRAGGSSQSNSEFVGLSEEELITVAHLLDATEIVDIHSALIRKMQADSRFADIIKYVDDHKLVNDLAKEAVEEALCWKGWHDTEVKLEAELEASYATWNEEKEVKALKQRSRAEGAAEACQWGSDLRDHFIKMYRRAGIELEERGGFSLCGVDMQMHHTKSGHLASRRVLCKSVGCATCGPLRLTQKVGAIIHLPVVDRQSGEVGPAMGDRDLWKYEVDNVSFAAIKVRWNRAISDQKATLDQANSRLTRQMLRSPYKIRSNRGPVTFGRPLMPQAYVVFKVTPDRWVFLSTLEIPTIYKDGGLSAPTKIQQQDVEKEVLELAKETFRFPEEQPRLEDFDGFVGFDLGSIAPLPKPQRKAKPDTESTQNKPGLLGSISSSANIALDPDRIWNLAHPSQWAGQGAVSHTKTKRVLESRGILYNQKRDGDGETIGVRSVNGIDRKTAVEIFTESRKIKKTEEQPATTPVAVEPPAAVDLTDDLQD